MTASTATFTRMTWRALQHGVEQALADVAAGRRVPGFRRVAVPAGSADALGWLACQSPSAARVYWHSRDRRYEAAVVGAARVVRGPRDATPAAILDQVRAVLRGSDPEVRAFGGMRFDGARAGELAWEPLGGYWFVVPRLELSRRGAEQELACHVHGGDDPAQVLAFLNEASLASAPVNDPHPFVESPPWVGAAALREREDVPDRAAWESIAAAALAAIRGGELEKIVLARCARLRLDAPRDAFALLEQLRGVTRDCFHFGFQPEAAMAFIGASPERFYRRVGASLDTEAVAGTRPRGASETEDRALGGDLLASDKERREHGCVRDAIEATLAPLSTTLRMDAHPALVKLARGQHLVSGVSAQLRDRVGDGELIARLHPTPAVGGTPTAAALARIREWEPFDRGWYAAPVGWIGRGAAEFAVAIRSALCHGDNLWLYSGAGVVDGSTAAEEWSEIENKIEGFRSILVGRGES